MNSWDEICCGPLHMDMLVLVKQKLYQFCVDTGCSLEDLPGEMDDRAGWRVRIKNLCCHCAFGIMVIYIYIYIYERRKAKTEEIYVYGLFVSQRVLTSIFFFKCKCVLQKLFWYEI